MGYSEQFKPTETVRTKLNTLKQELEQKQLELARNDYIKNALDIPEINSDFLGINAQELRSNLSTAFRRFTKNIGRSHESFLNDEPTFKEFRKALSLLPNNLSQEERSRFISMLDIIEKEVSEKSFKMPDKIKTTHKRPNQEAEAEPESESYESYIYNMSNDQLYNFVENFSINDSFSNYCYINKLVHNKENFYKFWKSIREPLQDKGFYDAKIHENFKKYEESHF